MPIQGAKTKLRLISWNVNGIRAAMTRGFEDFFKKHKPDILCLQETKAEQSNLSFDPKGYLQFWNSASKKGYSGTAVFSRIEPLDVRRGMGIRKHDDEGRILTLEYADFFLVNVYVPNARRELVRLTYRCDEWDIDFRKYLCALDRKKPVIFCGDMNVAHKEIDLANPKSNRRNAGFTDEERQGFEKLVKAGFVDTFRHFESGPGHYTWWTYRNNARARNIGWRIDYICVSERLLPSVLRANIHPEVMGSDHCPVSIQIQLHT